MIEIAAYNPLWPQEFQEEARRIKAALGDTAVRIDHVGSTAVPGLSAKPIIDIQVSVKQLTQLEHLEKALEPIGYQHLVHPDDAFAPFFYQPRMWPHTHHIHVVQSGGEEETRTLAFRDYLRGHPGTAALYEHLKRKLAALYTGQTPEQREAYANEKSHFIESIINITLG